MSPRLRNRPRPPGAVDRVLVATDRSETADAAVSWAAEMASRYEAELLVLQVVTDASAAAEEELAAFAAGVGAARARALVAVGDDPAGAIVGVAAAEAVDVLVVGSVGMQGRREFLLGNVPNRVSHNAPCTVVIVDTARYARR